MHTFSRVQVIHALFNFTLWWVWVFSELKKYNIFYSSSFSLSAHQTVLHFCVQSSKSQKQFLELSVIWGNFLCPAICLHIFAMLFPSLPTRSSSFHSKFTDLLWPSCALQKEKTRKLAGKKKKKASSVQLPTESYLPSFKMFRGI